MRASGATTVGSSAILSGTPRMRTMIQIGFSCDCWTGRLSGRQDRVRKDGFAAFQPSAGHEDFVEGLADFGFEVEAGNFFRDGAIDSEESVGRDRAGFGVGFREGLGIRVGPIVNNDGMCSEVRGL